MWEIDKALAFELQIKRDHLPSTYQAYQMIGVAVVEWLSYLLAEQRGPGFKTGSLHRSSNK